MISGRILGVAKPPGLLEINGTELAVRCCEAGTESLRPPGFTSVAALSCMEEKDRQFWLRVARVAADYFAEQVTGWQTRLNMEKENGEAPGHGDT